MMANAKESPEGELSELYQAYLSAFEQYREELGKTTASLRVPGDDESTLQIFLKQRAREIEAFARFREARRAYLEHIQRPGHVAA